MELQFNTEGLEDFITDKGMESDVGVWVRFPGDRRFRIFRAGGSNKAFTRAFQQAIKPYRRQMDRGTMDPEVSDKVLREVYCRHVIKDWDGIKTIGGEAIPFAPKTAMAFFETVPELFNEIVGLAGEAATFAEARLEEAQTVLGNSSTGTTDTGDS